MSEPPLTVELTPESVAFLLEHQRYRGCTMASLTIRERLEGVEAAARALTGPERQVKPAQPDELQRLTEALRPIVADWFDTGYEAGKLDSDELTARIVAGLRAALEGSDK